MSSPLGFDLRSHAQGVGHLSAIEKPRIQTGDIVRSKSSWLMMRTNAGDGEHVYCTSFIEPYSAPNLIVVG